MKKTFFSILIAALVAVTIGSCKKKPDDPIGKTPTAIALNKVTVTVEVGNTANLAVKFTPSDATGTVVWSVDDQTVATVANGIVTGVAAGQTTVAATCGSLSASCEVTVIPKSEIPIAKLLGGSNYYVFVMGETAFGEIQTKVIDDLRINGGYNEDGTVPEATTALLEIWGDTFIGGSEPEGLDPFKKGDGWITLISTDRTSQWGGGAGGLRILHRNVDLSAVTSDYHLVVIYKANSSVATDFAKFTVYTTGSTTTKSEWPMTENLGTTVWTAKTQGSWNLVEIPVSTFFGAGVNWSEEFVDGVTTGPNQDGLIVPKAFYSLGLWLSGYGNQLDLGTAFLYLPPAD
jgi:hypothetical protein